MATDSSDLHGNAPDQSPVALLLVDVINDLEFPDGQELMPQALEVAGNQALLVTEARRHSVPVVYVNDNFGRWQSNFREIVAHCLEDGVLGQPLVRKMLPEALDYFVLKPRHSGFYATSLEILLDHLGAKTLVVTGLTGDNCVLFTANDAYIRGYRVVVPSDCVASVDAGENRRMLKFMQRTLKADISPSTRLDLEKLVNGTAKLPG